MVTTETKMSAARAFVALLTATVALTVIGFLRMPIFELHVDSLKSSITQSLFTTDIYTPVAEKHISVLDFTKKCEQLEMAFKVAQGCTIAALICLGLAFVCGVLHIVPSFNKTNRGVCRAWGALTSIFLLLTISALSVNGYVLRRIYENDTWCTTQDKNDTQTIPWETVQPYDRSWKMPGLLREHTQPFAGAPARRVLDAPQPVAVVVPLSALPSFDYQPHARRASLSVDGKKCNPFDDCISSFRDMGFEQAAGYTTVWLALGIAVLSLVVEMFALAVAASVVPQAGIPEETASLLHEHDEDRVI